MAHVHANGYAKAVVDHPEAEIVKIWEDDPGRGAAATERFGIPYETDLEAVVASDDVDAVVVNAFTSQHPWVIKTALKYGKHVFTEKALCVKTEDADAIVEAVNKSGAKFMISLPSRTRPETLFMRRSWMRAGLATSRSCARGLLTMPPSTPGSTTAAPGSPMRRWRVVVRSSTWVATPST